MGTRRIRFTCHDGINDIAKRILEIGDLKMQDSSKKDSDDFESRSSGLSRSKSDHRLVSEFRRDEETAGRSRYRSRFLRGNDEDDESDRRNSKAMDEDPMTKKERNKVIDTEDCSRGPLSGCIRLADSSRVIQ